MRVSPLYQNVQTECGLCCCGMLISVHDRNFSMARFRQTYEVGRDGMAVRDIVGVLRDRGLRVRALRVKPGGAGGVPTPFIAFWGRRHFVVVEKVGDQGARIVDPGRGRIEIGADEFDAEFSGIAVTAEPAPGFAESRERPRSEWWRLLPYVRFAAGPLALLVAVSLVAFGAVLAVPMLTQALVDAYTAGQGGAGPGGAGLLVLVFAATAAGYLAAQTGKVLLTIRSVKRMGRFMADSVFEHLLRLPYKFFAMRSTGDLLFRLNNVTRLRDFLANDLVSGTMSVLLTLVLAGYMLARSPMLAAVAFALFALALALLFATRARISQASLSEVEEQAKGQAVQVEAVGAVSTIKTSGAEDEFVRAWEQANHRILDRYHRRAWWQGMTGAGIQAVQTLGPLLVVAAGLRLAPAAGMSLGEVMAFQVAASSFFAQASTTFTTVTKLFEVKALLYRIGDILDTPEDATFGDGTLETLDGRIELRDVWFSYSRYSAPVLRGVDLDVAPGQKVGIVGASGSGKSTLARLLAGLYRPTDGRIRYSGRAIGEYRKSAFFDSVAFVHQEVVLQNKTIRENVSWGTGRADPGSVEHAARRARIHDEILAMPMGYETLISQFGEGISGGQRQRILLARALLKNPRIVILDEATSSLDTVNERAIAAEFDDREAVRVVIAHRLSTIEDADVIYVMRDGEVVERGTHGELIAGGGEYAQLHRRQSAEREEPVGRG
ncbi:peptidase domain-containing ABC transporter [Streptomonospora salina]|uniref:ABC-type bacteriocin/lantibiotic exporter with double-glycine peptidase domain n=1 Tax=Streptomonospora salina TaxID=104205 RepID=A0A841E5Y1_9ACTN|nr:peptidase domain-containing ABC transporter [Streptomonospora salina]MBB5996588.1 ABC-type bacteriocin/lantibiotic exporter with double-glycine peptidase domain [Streptomonospora salina]